MVMKTSNEGKAKIPRNRLKTREMLAEVFYENFIVFIACDEFCI
jgi:hypothetical protein